MDPGRFASSCSFADFVRLIIRKDAGVQLSSLYVCELWPKYESVDDEKTIEHQG